MFRKAKLYLAAAAALACFAVPVSAAQAEYGMHSYEAQAQGNNIGYSRCVNESGFNAPWSCFTYYGSNVIGGDGYSWFVESDFVIATASGGRRSCYEITHWHAWMLNFIYVSPGC